MSVSTLAADVGTYKVQVGKFDEEFEGQQGEAKANFKFNEEHVHLHASAAAQGRVAKKKFDIWVADEDFEGEAYGPNAKARAHCDVGLSEGVRVAADAKAEVGKVSLAHKNGPYGVRAEAQGPNAIAHAHLDGGHGIAEFGKVDAQVDAKAEVGKVTLEEKCGPIMFKREARGPNACLKAGVGNRRNGFIAKAEAVGETQQVGSDDSVNVKVSAGLGVSTGFMAGLDGIEGKVAGTGIKAGKDGVGVSFLGTTLEVNWPKLW